MERKHRVVTLRFTDAEMVALEDKCHELRTTYQSVGHAFFMEWAAGDCPTPDEGEFVKCPRQFRSKIQAFIAMLVDPEKRRAYESGLAMARALAEKADLDEEAKREKNTEEGY